MEMTIGNKDVGLPRDLVSRIFKVDKIQERRNGNVFKLRTFVFVLTHPITHPPSPHTTLILSISICVFGSYSVSVLLFRVVYYVFHDKYI